ncbi:hypothetical protein SAMN05421742_11515 [Roseospirillum parvum]|uniref:Uncharacterized protein n=1 Tax=Roseospirillum parvum TaxID=83401 RepID=A0A1G8FN57_9PROT|nr:hypothetical protein SAMN05421742_11515 [Roseospirillum parvum]
MMRFKILWDYMMVSSGIRIDGHTAAERAAFERRLNA